MSEQNNMKKVVPVLVAAVVVVFGGRFLYNNYKYVETDNAKTAANSAVLSMKVGGMIDEILVKENQTVKAGDVLIRLDQRDLKNRLSKTEADYQGLQIRLADAERNYNRMKKLFETDTVSKQSFESTETLYKDLSKQFEGAKIALAQAKLDLEYSELKAPTDGKVGKRNIEKGVVVGPGQPLIAFVQSDEFWIVANFKETQLQNMKIGQKVEVEVDAIAGHSFEGKVESFAPSSGATFAVIPADNATGNFVKIVQRVPVRIVLEKESMKGFEDRLVPGLSVVSKVQVH
jgi:membrane fusion protein (multidrug efflux system)